MEDRCVIRPMRPDEADAVSRLIVSAIRADLTGCYPPAVLEGLLAGNGPAAVAAHAPKQTDYVCLLAETPGEAPGRLVAMLGLKKNEIGHLYVAPAFSRRGIGRRLVAFAAERFRAAGHEAMIVMSSLAAVGFYARCGFVELRRGSFLVAGGPLEYVLMRAPLA